MTFINVDSELVAQSAPLIQATAERIRSEISGMHTQLTSLSSAWQGLAASSFQELFERWRLAASGLETQLNEIAAAVALAADQYREIELANQRLFLG
jgi:early secretory antigenic target protein ESAT-6